MKRRTFVGTAVLWATAAVVDAQIANGSFETGDFTGWVVTDMAVPYVPLAVVPAGTPASFGLFGCPLVFSAPTDGGFSATHGFDGGGPGVIIVAQDVTLGPCDTRLLFDWTAGWEMSSVGIATLPREFHVDVEPVGGGAFLQRDVILTAAPLTDSCSTTGTGSVDLSAFAGGAVRISFECEIPEAFTGPGFFDFDNVRLSSPIANGSFETGDFTGWVAIDKAVPLLPLAVAPAGGAFGLCTPSTPTHGAFSAVNGFDGGGPDVITLAQDVTLGPCDATLLFDWKAELVNCGSLSREFRVDVEPFGGGPFFARTVIHTEPPACSVTCTGGPGLVDLSPFVGSSVRISFEWEVSEPFTGPGFAELDNVRVSCVPATSALRNGLGGNPVGFTELSPAIVGASWVTNVALPPGAVGSTVTVSLGGPISGFFLGGIFSGELLILPPFVPADVVAGSAHSIPIPPDCSLVGAGLTSQATSFTVGPLLLTFNNAIDFVIGSQ